MTPANLSEREQVLIELLTADNTLSVTEIGKRLEVSTVTVRGDLAALAEKGLIVRTHGGAFPAFHRSILERQGENIAAKTRIAKAAASLVHDGDTIMIEAGTTTALVAKFLLGKRDVHVVTNSALILPYARVNPALHLTLVGGEFRPSTESVVGPVALRNLDEFHVRLAFIGTDGFSLESGLTTHLVEGAEIVRKMSGQAATTILVADSSKYGKVGFARVVALESVQILVTDVGLSPRIAEDIHTCGPAVTAV